MAQINTLCTENLKFNTYVYYLLSNCNIFVFSGVLVDFISIPVTVGFTSATSVIIAVSQLKSLLGLQISTGGFLDTLVKVFQNLHQTRLADCLLGLGCIVILLMLRVSSVSYFIII